MTPQIPPREVLSNPPPLVYGSICSGIEAATVAWHPLGWKPSFFSEIDNFPRAVLQHHYPSVPLHGDFTTIQEHDYAAIDLLVGGTPCQAFSVAGLRKGFADERGNLTLEFVRLAQRLKPQWLVWENVPGVLSIDGGRAFGSFLGGLAELGYGFAYRVLDAQHFGVPPRRRRVFVVGYFGDWRPPAAILFERESLLRDLTPSRKTRESATHDVAPSLTSSGRGVERTGESLGQDPVIPCWWDGGQISQTLDAVLSKGQTMPEKNRFPAVLQPVTPSLTGNPYGDHESRDGVLAVVIWRNTSTEGKTYYTANPTRSFKSGGDTWRESDSLNSDDLLAMAELLRGNPPYSCPKPRPGLSRGFCLLGMKIVVARRK